MNTHQQRAQVANRLVSKISTADLRAFIAQARADGLSGNTIQKEMALLKHAFNMAASEWSWVDFTNSLAKVKLPKTARRAMLCSAPITRRASSKRSPGATIR
jgi:site-specific recombinase XerD